MAATTINLNDVDKIMQVATAISEQQQTPTPGIYPGVPESAYRAWSAISKSDIDQWVRGGDKLSGSHLVVGSALHAVVLEGKDKAKSMFTFAPTDYDLRTTAGKLEYDRLMADGKPIIRPKERAVIGAMADSILKNDVAAKILHAEGRNELSIVGRIASKNQEIPLLLKGRIDIERKNSIWDIKTTACLSEQEFKQSLVDYGYAEQAAWYQSLYAAITNRFLNYGFICVSKREPYSSWVSLMTPEQMAFGRKAITEKLTLYAQHGHG